MLPRARVGPVSEVREPGAKQAVADLQPVIEKTEWAICGERGQPERQSRELDSHRIDIDAV